MSTRPDPGIRERNRATIAAQLREVGRRHLAEHGAAALSLRAVARDMGRAPSALYRYVRDRDELLTLLIVDAYDDLGDALDAAVRTDASSRDQFEALTTALRTWTLANPSEYALLYGSPVPGYVAPADTTARAGNRPILALATIVAGLSDVPEVFGTRMDRQAAAAATLLPLTTEPSVAELGLNAEVLTRAITVWNLLLGALTAEAFEQLGQLTDQPDLVWSGVVDLAGALLWGAS